jgi:adenylate kinase
MRVIVLLGAPGSGKGTVAEKLRSTLGFVHVATGDMLRDELKRGTPLGQEAEGYMKRGELVPDALILRIVEARLDARGPADKFMFDGFPRTEEQATLLEQSLARRGSAIGHVFYLDTPQAVIMQRLSGRRVCRECGWTCHVTNIPPRKAGICDVCGGELYQRKDDTEATIDKRLDVYRRQTEGLIVRYRKRDLLVHVDGAQELGELLGAIEKVIAAGDASVKPGKRNAGRGS